MKKKQQRYLITLTHRLARFHRVEASYLEAGPGSNSRKAAVIVPSVFAALALLVGAALIATRHRRNQQEEDNTTTEFIEIGCVSHSHDYFCGSASAVA